MVSIKTDMSAHCLYLSIHSALLTLFSNKKAIIRVQIIIFDLFEYLATHQHKVIAYRSMVHRLLSIPLTKERFDKVEAYIMDTYIKNGFQPA